MPSKVQVSSEVQVIHTGGLALIQDLGRAGWAHIGVTNSGAADRRSHRLANRLVANPEDSATIEIALGGFAARTQGAAVEVAVTGADSNPSVDGIPFGINSVRHVLPGQTVTLSPPSAGLRSYLAIRGGFNLALTLGSRSYDTMSKIGPPPLQPGDILPVGDRPPTQPLLQLAPIAAIAGDPVELRVVPGPRDDWFADPSALIDTNWTVSGKSDRIGLRLLGQPLVARCPDRQLPSEGATRGAIQVPPSGQPVILGPDHPVTGGYPVIGVVVAADCDKFAQLRPGQGIRLRWHPASW